MDWGNVSAEDLIEALQEVDWLAPPRPLSEFFSKFTFPKTYSQCSSRLKCNLYYYRTNYFIMILLILGMAFLRRPLAIFAAALTALTIALLNDSFAWSFSERATRMAIQFYPNVAAKMRLSPRTPDVRARPSARRTIYICGQPRWVCVSLFASMSLFFWFVSCGLFTIIWSLSVSYLAIIAHASFRTPNLKARLNNLREEFRAVWRG